MLGGGSAQNLAAYDPATNTWSAVGGGVNGSVTALAVYDGELLVGGNFTRVGVGTASPQNIAFFARWNGSQWLAPDPSNPSYLLTGGAPLAFVEFQNKLYLAGNFTAAYYNETDKAYLAVWNKAAQRVEAAYPPGQGPDNNIWAAVVWNGALYLGGDFSTFGGASGKLVRFDGVQATGVPGAPTSGSVRALLPVGSTLYVAGSFTTVGGQTVNRIAALSSAGTWSGLGSGLGPTLVRTLALYNNYLYAGGGFTADGSGAGLSYLARFSSATPLVSQKAPSLFVVEVAPRAYALWAETPLLCHRLRLINAVGQTLYEEEGRLLQGEYLLPLLPAEGLYFLQVEGAGGEVYTYRFSTL
uniref:Uncharacterized protein n=1 Tax=uncultured Bacteroidota bacterium TaxID=152509 RepID=H5SK46_9BACT|nr:hypothetical protein HGMM_F40B03C20 [uncultured Bacteroidetes bacterium]